MGNKLEEELDDLIPMTSTNFNKDNLPICGVSYQNAILYCEKLTEVAQKADLISNGYYFTLPTEAQWEYASQSGISSVLNLLDIQFPRSEWEEFNIVEKNKLQRIAWYRDNSTVNGKEDYQPHPVGEKAPNGWMLYDMIGNVSEWCLDYYDAKYYSTSPSVDPVNRTKNDGNYPDSRVLRGGNYLSHALGCRSSGRDYRSSKELPSPNRLRENDDRQRQAHVKLLEAEKQWSYGKEGYITGLRIALVSK